MDAIYRQTYDAIDAEIEKLTTARDTIGRLLGITETPAAEAPPTKRRGGRPKKAAKRTKTKRAPKARKQAASARVDALKATSDVRAGGRQPSPKSAACRSAVLLALLAESTPQSFAQLKDAIAGVMKRNGVSTDADLTTVLQMTQTALRQKGLIERAAGAWKLTDAGRKDALSIRAAVKAGEARQTLRRERVLDRFRHLDRDAAVIAAVAWAFRVRKHRDWRARKIGKAA